MWEVSVLIIDNIFLLGWWRWWTDKFNPFEPYLKTIQILRTVCGWRTQKFIICLFLSFCLYMPVCILIFGFLDLSTVSVWMCMSVYLSVFFCHFLSVFVYMSESVCLPVCLSLSVCLSVCVCLPVSVCLYMSISLYPSVCVCLFVCVCFQSIGPLGRCFL